jgi:hypothetical protein
MHHSPSQKAYNCPASQKIRPSLKKILKRGILQKSVKNIQVWLKSDKNKKALCVTTYVHF